MDGIRWYHIPLLFILMALTWPYHKVKAMLMNRWLDGCPVYIGDIDKTVLLSSSGGKVFGRLK